MRIIKFDAESGIPSVKSQGTPLGLLSPKPRWSRKPVQQSSPPSATPGRKFHKAFSLSEVRHNFVIEALPKPAWFKSRPYLYTCARCKCAFRVNDTPGSIIPLDSNGEALPEPVRSRGVRTFAQGPCEVFPEFAIDRDA